MKSKLRIYIRILAILILLASIGMALYPTFSDKWNSAHQSTVSVAYNKAVEKLDDTDYEAQLKAAREYNQNRNYSINPYKLTEAEKEAYNANLNPTGNGMMGSIVIPSIDVDCPIYHGTTDEVLQVAIGHVEWSSLPTGGAGTHCVLSGHTGSSYAKLFTNLDRLKLGDRFMLNIMKETLVYEVDNIQVVIPEDVRIVLPEPERDLCSLITCTPFGVNSHRLVVTGHRVDNDATQVADEPSPSDNDAKTEPEVIVPVKSQSWIEKIWAEVSRLFGRLPDTAKKIILVYALLCLAVIFLVVLIRNIHAMKEEKRKRAQQTQEQTINREGVEAKNDKHD